MNDVIKDALNSQRETTLATLESVAQAHNFWVKRVTELTVASDADELQKHLAIFAIIDDFSDMLEGVAEKVKSLKAVLQNKILPAGFDTVGVPEQWVDDEKFSLAARVTGSFTDKEKGYDWLREIGEGGLIQETVHSQTLSAFLKRFVEDKAETPPSFVKLNTMEYVKRNGSKSAKRSKRMAANIG